jgi:hypothetical protein
MASSSSLKSVPEKEEKLSQTLLMFYFSTMHTQKTFLSESMAVGTIEGQRLDVQCGALAGEENAGGGKGSVLPDQVFPQRFLGRTGISAFLVPNEITIALHDTNTPVIYTM